ncbi:MAG: TrmO family methyltransferase domain-containing protein [Promethearchaeota archaeon]
MEERMEEKCEICEKRRDFNSVRNIDGKYYCNSCLFENNKPFEIYPIGYVNNNLKRGESFHLNGDRQKISEIHLFRSQEPFLYRLNDEKWIDVVFYLHKQKKLIKSKFHRGIDGKKVGAFASRTPDRLTPIAITGVEIIKIEGTTLFVRGLDAVDGTPVLDIKLGMKTFYH